MTDGFQVDVILSSLQHLKEVRNWNEKRLAEECGKRIDLETRLESVSARHSAVSARKTEVEESLKVAMEQSTLSEVQRNSLEQRCKEKRDEVRQLNDKMEELRKDEERALAEFSQQMTELTNKFQSAGAYYTEPHLASEVEDCTSETETLRERVLQKRAALSGLRDELSELQHQRQLRERETAAVTREQWNTLLDVVTNERGVAKARLERVELELSSLQQQVTGSSRVAQREE